MMKKTYLSPLSEPICVNIPKILNLGTNNKIENGSQSEGVTPGKEPGTTNNDETGERERNANSWNLWEDWE